MKTMCWRRFLRPILGVAGLALAGLSSGLAQTNTDNLIPVVTVRATQPMATTNQPGVFTVYRAGNTDATLNVWYDLGGTASNGVDYALIPPHLVAIAAGATSNTLVIAPTSNPPGAIIPKAVVLTLTNSPLMTPVNYEIGVPSEVTVYLESSNLPPTVRITSPADGAKFYTPTNIFLSAWTFGQFPVTNVEFFAGTNSLGFGSPYFIGAYPAENFQPYFLVWSNASVGAYVLTAIGHDNTGDSVTSAPVNITVFHGPPTNLPPVVSIFAPPNGATFYTPTNLPILAQASDSDGSVTNVEFFAGTNDLGKGLPVVLDPPGVNGFTGLVYWFNWMNPTPGNYPLTAVATDNGGLAATSAPVNISVLPGPATNLPPVVRIISPPDGAVFRAPISLPLYAYARANEPAANLFSDAVTNLEFYADGTDLGSAKHVFYGPPFTPGEPYPLYLVTLPHRFFLIWSNAPVGPHQLNAVAMDQFGNAATSAPVNLTVLASPPPPTNRPPIISIVATDPVAVEGTNAWVWPGETNSSPTWAAWPPRPVCFFTNRGPKTATFAVRRYGDISNALTVPYAIGGTASNGVDYATLPGSVTIPAGERRALISIVPIDDGPPDVSSTVVLTLSPSTNTPPDYVVGWPPRAAAIIIDRAGPPPLAGVLPGGWFHLAAPGPNAAWFGIEYSTDMIHWTPVCTNQVVNGSIDFVDPDAAGQPARFYRTVPVSGPPE